MVIPAEGIDYSRSALIEAGVSISYSELNRRVKALAAKLPRRRGLGFCFCRTDLSTVVNYLACLQARHPVALLDQNFSAESKARLLEQYRPNFILASDEVTPLDSPDTELHPDLALLLSTSGTTGNPKFVRLSMQNLISNAESIGQALAITPLDRAIASLPFHYSYGLSVLNSHLRAGASVALSTASIVSQPFWNTCREQRCTSLAGVPYTYQALHRLGLENLDAPHLKTLTQAGGKLSNDLISHFRSLMAARSGRFFVMYGQTEATARMAILPPADLPAKLGSVGLAIPGGRFTIDQGEVVYCGPNVMMGYASDRAELAGGDQQQGRLHTRDLGHLDSDGYLYIQARLGREAKIAGVRVNLDDVEAILRANGPTAAIARHEKIWLFCEWGDASGFTLAMRELTNRLRFSHHAFEFHRIPELPLSSNGKTDYQALECRL